MKYATVCLWILVPAVVCLTVTACRERPEAEPLLLLGDGDELADLPPAKGPVADNSRCHVCHINYEAERLAVLHARANIGCHRCHGLSDAHCGDEDNITPPEIMYSRVKVNPSCMACHPRKKIDTVKHKPLFAAAASKRKRCTDCHGKHRLSHRTRRWDKVTRKLIADDKVRMLTTPRPGKPPTP